MGHKLIHPQVVPHYMKEPSVQLAIWSPSEYNYHFSRTFLPNCMCSIRRHWGFICTRRLNSTNKYSQALEISLSTMFVRMTPSTASIRGIWSFITQMNLSEESITHPNTSYACSRSHQYPGHIPCIQSPFWSLESLTVSVKDVLRCLASVWESGPGHTNLQVEMHLQRFIFCAKSSLKRKWKPVLLLKVSKEENLKVTDPSGHSKELFPLHLPCSNQIQMGLLLVCH